MKQYGIDELIKKYPDLSICKNSILEAYDILVQCFLSGHKLLIAGNGGSSADADHIVGELMKGFKNKRKINDELSKRLNEIDPVNGKELSEKLQQGLPAIALHNHQALNTAFINDVDYSGQLTFAQQVLGYGQPGDVLLAISTSGNSQNVYNACVVAKAKNLRVIGLTGKDGGILKTVSDVAIIAPSNETFEIQEYHLPIYHLLCLMLEERFFK